MESFSRSVSIPPSAFIAAVLSGALGTAAGAIVLALLLAALLIPIVTAIALIACVSFAIVALGVVIWSKRRTDRGQAEVVDLAQSEV